ncbi:hypothetical protein Hte_011659 [Hypoxylon texense]
MNIDEANSVVSRMVRRVVEGEAEASDIVRALLSKDYAKIVDTYADEDFTVVEEEIQSVCAAIRDQKRSGAWQETERVLKKHLEDTKHRKALALLEAWKAGEEATDEANTKGNFGSGEKCEAGEGSAHSESYPDGLNGPRTTSFPDLTIPSNAFVNRGTTNLPSLAPKPQPALCLADCPQEAWEPTTFCSEPE